MTTWKEIVVDSNSEVWDREKAIEGTFLKTETEIGPNKSNMYTIKTKDGEVKVWGSTVLDDKLMGVPTGTYVKIEYEGKLASKKGTQYHSYKVFIDEAEDRNDDSAKTETLDDPIKLSDIPFS